VTVLTLRCSIKSSTLKCQLDKVDFLTEASNRKHPTQPQLKILKEKLPELQVLPHIISSNIFRQQLINREFLEGIAQLAKDRFQEYLYLEPDDSSVSHRRWVTDSKQIENVQKYGNDQRLISAMGEQLWKNFLDSIISVIEVVCARPEMLSSYSDVIILHTLPLLANLLVTDKNSGSKLLYIKLINDLLEILIEKREHGNLFWTRAPLDLQSGSWIPECQSNFLGDEITEINLSDEQKISLVDEIPSLLLNEAPLPVFSLRLFYQLILYAYADFANFIPKSGIIEVLITFVEMQSTEQSNQMLQKQLYPLLSLLWEKCHLDSIFLLLENDFITVSFQIA